MLRYAVATARSSPRRLVRARDHGGVDAVRVYEDAYGIVRTSRWEAKLAALAEAQSALATARAVNPELPEHDALQSLPADLLRLWDASTTSPRDRNACCARSSPT